MNSSIGILIFPSNLGWMAVVVADAAVEQLTFGHSSPIAAKRALDRKTFEYAGLGERDSPLARRLQAFTSGEIDDFRDVRVDPGPLGDFQRRLLEQCRRIPYGHTVSYAELAAKTGFPRAARAVGNCLAANRIPLIVPCHRVIRSDGRIGLYSAPGGTPMKRRLLALEARKSGTLSS